MTPMEVGTVERGLEPLRAVLRDMGETVVCLSGGVDSALVTAVARDVLGDDAIAITALSPTLPREEAEIARGLAERIGIRHLVVEAHELEREGYARNSGDRCYFCKTELFDLARAKANELGVRWIADGTITDDLGDVRPGLKAAEEHAVRHPLVEAGMGKAQVRAAAKALGLEVWDKPSFACLGSRFPVGTRVTLERVERVGLVESRLRALGFRQFRARWHELAGAPIVRLELDPEELALATKPGVREAIVEVCKEQGFRHVTLDLEGYARRA